jgi:hypothetical protein
MFADPNSELLKQLARIADALSKTSPSPWIEWARTLASFVVGMAVSYFSIMFQNTTGDRHEQRRMRQIVYRELTESILQLCSFVDNMSGMKPRVSSSGSIRQPSFQIMNPPFTFEGAEYMRQNHDVSYGLPEMIMLKRMYEDYRRFSPGKSVSIGEFKAPLVRFGQAFSKHPIIRKNFKRFAGDDFPSIQSIANHFADYKIRVEEIMELVPVSDGKPDGEPTTENR